MSDAADPALELLVVLDPDFGDLLRDAWRGQPVWITMSSVNAPVVHALWTSAPSQDHLNGITGFKHVDGLTAEDRFLDELSTIDLHHGPYSTTTPYIVLTVIGTGLTETIKAALSDFGFSAFRQRPGGFTANRSEDEARRQRG
jgi:hypothetical protein